MVVYIPVPFYPINILQPNTIMILGTENYRQPKSLWTNGDIA